MPTGGASSSSSQPITAVASSGELGEWRIDNPNDYVERGVTRLTTEVSDSSEFFLSQAKKGEYCETEWFDVAPHLGVPGLSRIKIKFYPRGQSWAAKKHDGCCAIELETENENGDFVDSKQVQQFETAAMQAQQEAGEDDVDAVEKSMHLYSVAFVVNNAFESESVKVKWWGYDSKGGDGIARTKIEAKTSVVNPFTLGLILKTTAAP